MNKMKLIKLTPQELDIYHVEGFEPTIVDASYLNNLNVEVIPSEQTLEGLKKGSIQFIERFKTRTILPLQALILEDIDIHSELEIHNYTGACPTLTYEINPVVGCHVGCLYCLVTDGEHIKPLKAYQNYHELVARVLAEKHEEEHYFYFSPKTECFQEPTLQTGIAHKILKAFVAHYKDFPNSKARLFIASKAGMKQLLYRFEGKSILEYLIELKGKVQFNTSVSIMPYRLRELLEPFAATIEDRLEAVKCCQRHGIMANSALVQPIVAPFLTPEILHDFFQKLKDANIINYKPEFLTLCMENLAMIGQIQGHESKELERKLYEYYIAPSNETHRKQRGRTAPSKKVSQAYLKQMMAISKTYGLSISICYWVRKELGIQEKEIPIINHNGFQCLGYQSKLFSDREESL